MDDYEEIVAMLQGIKCNSKALEYLSIPESVKYIRETSFVLCDSLVAINVDEDNDTYCSVDGVLFSESMIELIKYPACKADEYYSIPEGVTDIASHAFYNCKKLNRVTIPDGVSVIASYVRGYTLRCCSHRRKRLQQLS